MNKEVTFKISPDGMKVDADAEGFVGQECEDFAKLTLDALGEVEDKKRKPEFFQTIGNGQTTKA